MTTTDRPDDDLLASLGTLIPHDLGAARADAVRHHAHEILARRRRRGSRALPSLAALGRCAEPLLAAGLGAGFFLWLVGRCLQIYGLLPA
jgi:hypothetical protein